MPTEQVAITARDGWFFKDGRGWFAAASGRARGLEWPFPGTVLGALRTAWGRAIEGDGAPLTATAWGQASRVTLGATLGLRRPLVAGRWSPEHRMWPAPADALYLPGSGDVQPLLPAEPPPGCRVPTVGRDDDPARELLWWPPLLDPAKPEPGPTWWPDEDFVAWLAGQPVTKRSAAAREALALPRRADPHNALDPVTLTGIDGMLFAGETTETLVADGGVGSVCEWAIGAVVSTPDPSPELAGQALTLGGDRRLATTEAVDHELFHAPAALGAAFADAQTGLATGLRLILVTPACFRYGWVPDGLQRVAGDGSGPRFEGHLPGLDSAVVLRSAYVPRALHVSGWSMRRGKHGEPKRTRRLVAPGAVYFVEKADASAFTSADASALWLQAIGQETQQGYGRVVPGVWRRLAGTRR